MDSTGLLAMVGDAYKKVATQFKTRTIKTPNGDNVVLVKSLGSGGFGGVWSAEIKENPVVVKLFDLKGSKRKKVGNEFVSEVYAHKMLRVGDRKAICKKHARCGTQSFYHKDSGTGVIVFDSPLEDPVDLSTKIEQLFNFVSTSDMPQVKKEARVTRDILSLALDIVDDVDALHKNGIAHRDIKPDNILVDSVFKEGANFGVLIDFNFTVPFKHSRKIFFDERGPLKGISAFYNQEEYKNEIPPFFTKLGIIGTPLYMKPKFTKKAPKSKKDLIENDIFAVGVTLYELETLGNEKDRLNKMSFGDTFEWKPPSEDILLLNSVIQGLVDNEMTLKTAKGEIRKILKTQGK